MKIVKNLGIRVVGLAMMTFLPGMGVGAVVAKDWLTGGAIAFGTACATVIVYLGVALAWSGKATDSDIQEAFRTATAKAGETNDEVHAAIADLSAPVAPTPPVAG
jgi:hypothetical protein